jgi:hypothetical protein
LAAALKEAPTNILSPSPPPSANTIASASSFKSALSRDHYEATKIDNSSSPQTVFSSSSSFFKSNQSTPRILVRISIVSLFFLIFALYVSCRTREVEQKYSTECTPILKAID